MLSCRKLDYDFWGKSSLRLVNWICQIWQFLRQMCQFFLFFFFWQNLVFQMSIFCHARLRSNKINSKWVKCWKDSSCKQSFYLSPMDKLSTKDQSMAPSSKSILSNSTFTNDDVNIVHPKFLSLLIQAYCCCVTMVTEKVLQLSNHTFLCLCLFSCFEEILKSMLEWTIWYLIWKA